VLSVKRSCGCEARARFPNEAMDRILPELDLEESRLEISVAAPYSDRRFGSAARVDRAIDRSLAFTVERRAR
jgi:hypothetical protein